MALTFTWSSSYEQSPSNQIPRNQIDGEIRRLKQRIGAIMDREHNWIGGDGKHKPGLTSVVDSGDEAKMLAISDPQEGAIFLRTDGSNLRLSMFLDGSWTVISSLDHQNLSDRNSGDPHPQYMDKGVTVETFEGGLDMNSYVLRINQDDFIRGSHVTNSHGAVDSRALNDVIRTMIFGFLSDSSLDISVSGSTWVTSKNDNLQLVEVPVSANVGFFAPNIYVGDSDEAPKTVFCMSGHWSDSSPSDNPSSLILAKPNNGVSPSYRLNIKAVRA